jgi:hypothetical protein
MRSLTPMKRTASDKRWEQKPDDKGFTVRATQESQISKWNPLIQNSCITSRQEICEAFRKEHMILRKMFKMRMIEHFIKCKESFLTQKQMEGRDEG